MIRGNRGGLHEMSELIMGRGVYDINDTPGAYALLAAM